MHSQTQKAAQNLAITLLGFVLLLFSTSQIHAQVQKSIAPEFGFDMNFNHTDIFMGGRVGICFPVINASVAATFKGRLGSKRVLLETGQKDVLIQYRERRYLLGLEADKRFILNEFGPSTQFGGFIGGFGGLGFGDYRGTSERAPLGLSGAGMLGAYISDPNAVILRFGYMYLPLRTETVVKHRIYVSFTILVM